MEFLISLAIGLFVAGGFWSWYWFTGRVRDAPTGWRTVPRRRRREIRRGVLQGRAIEGTPDEARLATEVATALLSKMSVRRRSLLACTWSLLAAYWIFLGLAHHDRAWAGFAALYVVLIPYQLWWWRRASRRLNQAYAANSALGYGAI